MNQNDKTPRKKKCILTFARAWNTLAATRCLGRQGIEVITGDTSTFAAANFSRYSKEHFTYPNPDEDPEGFIDKLVHVALSHWAPDTDIVLMPLHTDTYAVVRNQTRFERLVKMALPSKDQFELAGNKNKLAHFCEKFKINMPPTLVVDKPSDFAKGARKFNYPAFLKIPTSTASIGMRKVNSDDEAIRYFNEMIKQYDLTKPAQYPILQQCVEGEDYCATFLFDHGERRACMTYHNILNYPRGSGMGAVRETVDVPEIEAMGSEILRKMNWHGLAEIDFRWDKVSEPWLIEINPRFWGGLAQSIESGWDYPHLLYKLAVENSVESVNPEKRYVRTWNPALTILLAFQEFMESRHSQKELAHAYKEFQNEFKKDNFKAIGGLLGKVGAVLDPRERFNAIKSIEKVLKDEHGAVNEFFSWEDPLPMLGLLYPLMVFIRHGQISPELLIGKAKIDEEESGGT